MPELPARPPSTTSHAGGAKPNKAGALSHGDPHPPQHIAEVAPKRMLPIGGPLYDPPYETPLEDELAWHLVKYLRRTTTLAYQHKVVTPAGTFWVDFVLEHQGACIGIECEPAGGQTDAQHARHRAALIVGTGAVDVLYRLPAAGLFYHLDDLLFLLAQWHPSFFTDRARINLERLASPTARAHAARPQGREKSLPYPAALAPAEPALPADGPMRLQVLYRARPADWVRDHDVALSHYATLPRTA